MRYTGLVIATLSIVSTLAAHASDIVAPPFRAGEKIRYVLKWKKGVSITAGHLTTEITSLDLQSGKAEFKATAVSTAVVDAFYPIRYTILSSMDLGSMASTRFSLIGSEKKDTKAQIESFDYSKQEGVLDYKENSKRKFRIDREKNNLDLAKNPAEDKPETYRLTERVQDVLSVLYWVRAAKLPTSEGEVKVPVVYEGEIWTTTIKFLDEETSKINGIRYPTYKYQMTNVSPKGETNSATTFWIAGDTTKTLTRVESEIEVGKIILKLRDAASGEE